MFKRLVGLGLLLSLLGPANAQDESHAFRGFKLGMTADEFRKIPHPDQSKSWLAKRKLKVFCTGDPVRKDRIIGPPEVMLTDAEQKAGIIKCTYADDHLSSVDVTVDGIGSSRFEFFRPNDKEPYRLYSILVLLPERMFKEVSEAFTDKLGKPTGEATQEVQNNFGAKFENRMLVWKNSVSFVMLQQRSGRVDTTAVIYTHDALSTAAEMQAKQAKGLKDQL